MNQPDGAFLPSIHERRPTAEAERLRSSVADWSAALAAVSDMPSAVRQDVVDALELARRFNVEVVRPQALLLDRSAQEAPGSLPHELIRQAADWGLFTLWLPSLFGGKGWNFISLYAFLEEVSTACVGVANVIGVHYMGVATLVATWNLRLAEQVFGEVCAGERRGEPCLLSVAFNEPQAGTDVADTILLDRAQLTMRAQVQPDGSCLLDGRKSWISNGHVATWHMVVAFEDLAHPADTMMIAAVRADAPGLRLGRVENKLGQRACVASELTFEQCRIPADQIALSRQLTRGLGRPHRDIAQTMFDYISSCTRAGVGAFAAGTARGALEAARDHAARKTLPCGRLIEQQWAQSMLAEMSQNATLARQAYLEATLANGMGGLFHMMFYRPLYWVDQLAPMGLLRMVARRVLHSPKAAHWFQHRLLGSQPREWQGLTAGLASLAKVAGSDLAMRNVGLALDLVGAEGLRQDVGIEKRLRDAKVLQIYEGTNQLNRVNLFKCRVRPDEGVRVFVREASGGTWPGASQAAWPADGHDDWWQVAAEFARARQAKAGQSQQASWLDPMHGMGWSALCGDAAWGGQGQPVPVLCRVLEALSAANASAASAVYASAAANLALCMADGSVRRHAVARDIASDWLAWPAFHDIDEQLWPMLDAQGHLRGHVDMLMLGAQARWAVLPAQGSDHTLQLVLVDLSHPAVVRGAVVRTLGLSAAGIHDVEFGGVPCELVSTQGRALFAQVSARLAPAAMALQCGVARACLDEAMRHAATRQQGGGTLMGWGEVRRILSLMQERLHVMQGLLLSALSGQAEPGTSASYAALHVGQLACAQTEDGLQIMGGNGYVADGPQATHLCDARQLQGLMGGVAWRRQGLLAQSLHE